MTGKYADYTGHLADQPGVNYVLDDGRSYLERADGKYDLVWFPAPDSYAAANAASSGAFVLSESYLYTKQTVKDSLDHLRPNGILAAQFGEVDFANKPNRTARYASTVREALDEMGIDDVANHVMVITTPSDLPPATIITTTANRLLSPLHERMPVILDPADYSQWLDAEATEPGPLEQLLVPYPAEKMTIYPVGTTVNSARQDTPECIAQVAPAKIQGTLFD